LNEDITLIFKYYGGQCEMSCNITAEWKFCPYGFWEKTSHTIEVDPLDEEYIENNQTYYIKFANGKFWLAMGRLLCPLLGYQKGEDTIVFKKK